MMNLVIFKKQKGEKTNAYSLVNDELLKTIPKDIVLKVKKVEDKLYSKEELEKMRGGIV
jgi:hypothetical protein